MRIKREDGSELKVFIIKSKANQSKKGLSGFIFAHGGGALIGHAVIDNGILCKLAIENNIVIVNVEYRLAPEHKSPAGA